MTKTISIYDDEQKAQWVLSSAEGFSTVEVEDIIEGNNHHITFRSNDGLGKTMILRLIDHIERNWSEDDYMIS